MKVFITLVVLLTTGASAAIDCSGYTPGVCTPDTIVYCLTDGTIIDGSCDTFVEVCENNKVVDETFDACTSPFNCTGYNPTFPCQPDLISYCFTNGEEIAGSCEARRAVCVDGLQIDISGESCRNPTTTDQFGCINYDPNIHCTTDDNTDYCLTGSANDPVDYCGARKGVCGDKLSIIQCSSTARNITPLTFLTFVLSTFTFFQYLI